MASLRRDWLAGCVPAGRISSGTCLPLAHLAAPARVPAALPVAAVVLLPRPVRRRRPVPRVPRESTSFFVPVHWTDVQSVVLGPIRFPGAPTAWCAQRGPLPPSMDLYAVRTIPNVINHTTSTMLTAPLTSTQTAKCVLVTCFAMDPLPSPAPVANIIGWSRC